jgi:glycosyltransferase involved in cell wall biosynthesis
MMQRKVTAPLVSVLTTLYNREKFIATTIESVLAQSMEDFELIIVDDCSRDDSVAIAKRYEHDPRVKVHVNVKNLGDYPNRNRAASLARGKYLKYVDCDDAIYPHCLEVMTHMMQRHPKAGMLLSAWSQNDPYYPFELSPLEGYRRCFIHGERMSNSTLTTMFRKSAFDAVGGFDSRWPLCGDWGTILKIARHFAVLFAPTGLAFYRVHENQILATTAYSLLFKEGTAISLASLRHPECPLPSNERKWAMGKILRGLLIYFSTLAFVRKRPRAALDLLRSLSIRPQEWASVCEIRRPSVSRLKLAAGPDWADYPRARTIYTDSTPEPFGGNFLSGRNAKASDNGSSDYVGIARDFGATAQTYLAKTASTTAIIAGSADTQSWERTISSVLAQSARELQIIAVQSPACSHFPMNLMKKYPCIRVVASEEGDIWAIRNQMVELAQGAYLRFIEPGTLLYPYSIEFDAHVLSTYRDIGFVSKGYITASVVPMLRLDPLTTLACEFHGSWWVFRDALPCTSLRKSAFNREGGFSAEWGAWAAHELFFRLALRGGTACGFLGLVSNENDPVPDLSQIPDDLWFHYENLFRQRFCSSEGQVAWRGFLKDCSEPLWLKTLESYHWDWSRFPWQYSCVPRPTSCN